MESLYGVNQKGNMTIAGCDAVELAKEYGTPLYVMNEEYIDFACGSFVGAIQKHYDGNGMALFANKAFCCKAMCKAVSERGFGLDVSSEGELYTALSAGVPAEKICLHGNNKTYAALKYAIENKVGWIMVDHRPELEMIEEISAKLGVVTPVMFRVKPGVDAHTHDFVRTGQIDSKFGVALETGEALDFAKDILAMPNVSLEGVHCHIGSQIFDTEPFVLATEKMMAFIKEIKDTLGVTLRKLDIGGGFGIRYTEEDDPKPFERYVEEICKTIKKEATRYDLPLPYLLLEPGRCIASPAGTTLYTVGAIKEIPDIRSYLLIDGGMNDNPRYALYGAKYTFEVANRMKETKNAEYTIAGRTCESGDLLGEGVPLQKAHSGDILATLCTGAYCYSMSSNYNRYPRPAAVMVKDGASRLIIRRETLEEVASHDL